MSRLPRLSRALLLLALPLVGSACAGPQLRDGVYDNGNVRYSLEVPGEGWRRLDIEQANVAWHEPQLGAALLVNSHCQGVEDAPLEVLTRHLLIGLTDTETVGERRFLLSGREALETTVDAKLDGVPRRLQVLVLKKDGCVYDVVLDAAPETFSRAVPAYERVKSSLDVHPREDWS